MTATLAANREISAVGGAETSVVTQTTVSLAVLTSRESHGAPHSRDASQSRPW